MVRRHRALPVGRPMVARLTLSGPWFGYCLTEFTCRLTGSPRNPAFSPERCSRCGGWSRSRLGTLVCAPRFVASQLEADGLRTGSPSPKSRPGRANRQRSRYQRGGRSSASALPSDSELSHDIGDSTVGRTGQQSAEESTPRVEPRPRRQDARVVAASCTNAGTNGGRPGSLVASTAASDAAAAARANSVA